MGSSKDASTKVYYRLDDSIPYMSVVPVDADNITLADFKKFFARRGYSYFCKEYDADLKREVKVEITLDSQRLHKSSNGLIELFLLSLNPNQNCVNNSSAYQPGSSNVTYGNSDTLPTSFNKKNNYGGDNMDMGKIGAGYRKLNKRNSSGRALSSIVDEFDVRGGQRVSMVTNNCRSISGEASSDINTLISKRAGEQLAEHYSASEDQYKLDETSEQTFMIPTKNYNNQNYSDYYTTSLANNNNNILNGTRQRKPRKQRYRKAYVPSTISSASESSMSVSLPRVDEVQIRLQDANYLGITVACHDGGVFIGHIKPDSAADKCGKLEVGDQIVQIEHTSFENLTDKQAVDVIKKVSLMKRTITIYVAKRPRMSDQKSGDTLSLLCETMQLDVSQWVEATKKKNVEPVSPFFDIGLSNVDYNENKTFPLKTSFKKETYPIPGFEDQQSCVTSSDEERAAYADRRNGVGARFVPALMNNKHANQVLLKSSQEVESKTALTKTPLQMKLQEEAPENSYNLLENPNGNFRENSPQILTTKTNPILVLKTMARLDSDLEIKNRTWLKIPVPNSFIGNEMIDWLLRNVKGFPNRKAARAYASELLNKEYIKHVVKLNTFNEKCYYIFTDFIINERILQSRPDSDHLKHTNLSSGNSKPSDTLRTGLGAESTTEITYMSNPLSPPFLNHVHGIGILPNNQLLKPAQKFNNPGGILVANNPRYLSSKKNKTSDKINIDNNAQIPASTAIWPISPISSLCETSTNNNNNPLFNLDVGRIDCESLNTNDYASMIQGDINNIKSSSNKSPQIIANSSAQFTSNPQSHTSKIPPAPQRSAPLLPNVFMMS